MAEGAPVAKSVQLRQPFTVVSEVDDDLLCSFRTDDND